MYSPIQYNIHVQWMCGVSVDAKRLKCHLWLRSHRLQSPGICDETVLMVSLELEWCSRYFSVLLQPKNM